MKILRLMICLLAIATITVLNNREACAAENDLVETSDRLERLERQVQQLTQQRDPGYERPEFNPERSSYQPQGMCRPGARCRGAIRMLIALIVVINIMLAVWVYGDIRKRGEGSGLFIILALLGGIPGTILYALVRIGDRKSTNTTS